jgi:hypothetical protein
MPLEHPFRMPLRPIKHPFDAGKIASAAQAEMVLLLDHQQVPARHTAAIVVLDYSEFLPHNEGAVVLDFAAAVFQIPKTTQSPALLGDPH